MENSRQSLIPSFLYTSSSSRTVALEKLLGSSFSAFAPSPAPTLDSSPADNQPGFLAPAPSEPRKKIEMYSSEFYAACTAGGILSCGLTHMAVTPLDLVKCNMQVRFRRSVISLLANSCSDLDLPLLLFQFFLYFDFAGLSLSVLEFSSRYSSRRLSKSL